MSRYSPSGYIIALRTRSAHTVLAEGKNDQMIIRYCLLKSYQNDDQAHSKYVIDTAEIIESDGVNISNRSKVKAVYGHAKTNKLLDRVTCFADREYDCFDMSSRDIDLCPYHKVEGESLFYTRGHSVENYFFDKDFLLNYLEFNHARDLMPGYRFLISKNWDIIILNAASLSFAIAQSDLLDHCAHMFTISHWQATGETLSIDENAFRLTLTERNIEQMTIDQILKDYHENVAKLSVSFAVCRWIVHGHMGLNMMSSGIAKMLSVCGMTPEASRSVIGFTELKIKYFCEQWHSRYSSDTNFFPVFFFNRITQKIT